MTVTKEQLREHLANAAYDTTYQDIEVLGIVGHDSNSSSWRKIKSLYSFENKTVCDLGCFHGYYAMKALDSGATWAKGLDKSQTVLNTAKMISEVAGYTNIEYMQWVGGELTPHCDVALVLNMLHHTDDIEKTLVSLQCISAIFECNIEELSDISKHYRIQRTVEGRSYASRPSRMIVLADKI